MKCQRCGTKIKGLRCPKCGFQNNPHPAKFEIKHSKLNTPKEVKTISTKDEINLQVKHEEARIIRLTVRAERQDPHLYDVVKKPPKEAKKSSNEIYKTTS